VVNFFVVNAYRVVSEFVVISGKLFREHWSTFSLTFTVLRTAFIKILGNQYTGISSVFTTILTMLSLSELGFGTAIATALYKPLKDRDTIKIQQLMYFYKKAYYFVAGFILIIGLALTPFLKYLIKDVPDIKEDIRLIYSMYIIKTSVSYLMIYKTTLLNADQKIYIVKKLEMICQAIRYIIEVVALIIFREFLLYLIIEIAATIVQNLIITKKAEKEYPYAFQRPENTLSKPSMLSLMKDVKGLSLFKLSGTIGNSIDTILISGFINTSTVAIVGNYTLIKDHLYKLLMQFFTSVIPSIGNLAAEGSGEKQEIVFNRLFYISFLVVNFCSTSMFVLFRPFISLWLGSDYLLSTQISFVISFDFFLYILLEAVASFRTANGLFVKGQYRPLVTALLNVVLSVLLIKRYGIFGTIFATIIARLTTQWYDPFLLYKYIFKKSFGKFYVRYLCYIVIYLCGMMLSGYLYMKFTGFNMLSDLLIGIMICLIVPNAISVILTFKSDEFNYFKKMLFKRV